MLFVDSRSSQGSCYVGSNNEAVNRNLGTIANRETGDSSNGVDFTLLFPAKFRKQPDSFSTFKMLSSPNHLQARITMTSLRAHWAQEQQTTNLFDETMICSADCFRVPVHPACVFLTHEPYICPSFLPCPYSTQTWTCARRAFSRVETKTFSQWAIIPRRPALASV